MNLKLSYLRRVKWLLIIILFPLASMAQQTYPKVTPEQGAGYSGNIRVVKNGFVPPLTNGLPSTAVKFTVPQGLIPFGIDTTGKRLWWYDQQADTIAWIRPGATGGTGAPIGNLGNAVRIISSGNARSLRGSYALIYDTLTTGEIRGTVDTSKVLPEASTIIANGVYSAAPGGGHRYILVDDQFTYDNGNVTQANGWVMTRNPDGIQAQDTATGSNNFYFGNQGIKNTALANNGSYNATKFDAQGNLVNTFISSGGGGTNNRQVYAGNGLNKVNDSTLELSVPYTNGLYPQLAVSYNNPTWINTLAYSKLTGVPDFAGTYVPYIGANAPLDMGVYSIKTPSLFLGNWNIIDNDDLQFWVYGRNPFTVTSGGAFSIHTTDGQGNIHNVILDPSNLTDDYINYFPNGTGTLALTPNADGSIFPSNANGYLKNDGSGNLTWAPVSGGNGRTYYAQSPLFKANDSTFAIQYVSGSQGGALSATDWNMFNNKENSYSVVPYSNTLQFSRNKTSLPHTQSGAETFMVSGDSLNIGKTIRLTIVSDSSGLTFPSNFIWKFNRLPQLGKINDLTFFYRADGNVDAEVSTRNQNYANLIYSVTGQSSFNTYAGYDFTKIYFVNPTSNPISVSIGTTVGGSDVFGSETVSGNTITPLIINKSFDVVTPIYLTGVCSTCYWKANNPSLNNN